MDLQTGSLGDGPHEGDDRTLAVCSRHMDDGWQVYLRVSQSGEQTFNPSQGKINFLGVMPVKAGDDVRTTQQRCPRRPWRQT